MNRKRKTENSVSNLKCFFLFLNQFKRKTCILLMREKKRWVRVDCLCFVCAKLLKDYRCLDSMRALIFRTVVPFCWNAFRLKNAFMEFIELYSRLSVMPLPTEMLWWRRMLHVRAPFALYLSSSWSKQSLVVLAASSRKMVWCKSGESDGTSRLNWVTRNLVRRFVIGHGTDPNVHGDVDSDELVDVVLVAFKWFPKLVEMVSSVVFVDAFTTFLNIDGNSSSDLKRSVKSLTTDFVANDDDDDDDVAVLSNSDFEWIILLTVTFSVLLELLKLVAFFKFFITSVRLVCNFVSAIAVVCILAVFVRDSSMRLLNSLSSSFSDDRTSRRSDNFLISSAKLRRSTPDVWFIT